MLHAWHSLSGSPYHHELSSAYGRWAEGEANSEETGINLLIQLLCCGLLSLCVCSQHSLMITLTGLEVSEAAVVESYLIVGSLSMASASCFPLGRHTLNVPELCGFFWQIATVEYWLSDLKSGLSQGLSAFLRANNENWSMVLVVGGGRWGWGLGWRLREEEQAQIIVQRPLNYVWLCISIILHYFFLIRNKASF